MRSVVQLNTTGLTHPVSISAFQFGTVPAPPGSSQQLTQSLPEGSTGVEIFWLERDLNIPINEFIRFNLRFEINLHNSANLQIALSPLKSGSAMVWRWSAPIGYTGQWSAAEQQAPWYDDNMDYCINISPSSTGIAVSLSEHPGKENEQCSFIPKEDSKSKMVRHN